MASRVEAKRWAVAAACVAGAVLVHMLLGRWIDGRAALLAFAPSAMLAAWFGGFAPGAVVAVVGAVYADALLLPPPGIHSVAEGVVLATFLAIAFIGIVACTVIHELRGRLRRALGEIAAQRRTLQHELDQRRRSEQTLREMEKFSRRVIDANVIGLVLADLAGNLLEANDAFLNLVGYARADLDAGRLNLSELTPLELHHLDHHAAAQTRTRGRHDPFEKQFVRADGSRVPVLFGTALMPGAADVVIGFIVDLSPHKRAEAALKLGEHRFAAFMENLPGAAWMKDMSGRYVYANAEALRAFAISADQLIGKTDDEVFPPRMARAFVENDQRVLEVGGSLTTVEVHPQADGVDHHSLISKFAVPGPEGTTAYVGGVAVDITSRIAAEQALRDSEQRFRGFAENTDDVLWIADPHARRLVYVSPSYDQVYGRPAAEIYENLRRFAEYIHPDDRALVASAWDHCMDGSNTIEYRVIRPDGSTIWVRDRSFPVVDDAGALRYVAGIAEDVTVQKWAAHALRESERRYRFMAESIPQIVFTARPDGVVNYYSEQLLRYTGATRQQLRALGWIHFRHPDDRDEATRRWKHSVATGEPYECMYRMRRGDDETWRWHLARATPMRDESGDITMWFGTCTDVDDHRRARDAMEKSEREFRAVFELAGSGKAMVEAATGRFVRVNHKLCEMTGYESEELLAMTFTDITHPDDRAWSTRESNRMMTGEIPVYNAEKRYVRKDGQVIWVHIIATLIRDADGNPYRAAGVIQDVTQRKLAEAKLRESEASLARAQRIAGVGSWEFDLRTREMSWSDQMYRIFGVERGAFAPTAENVFAFIPEEEHESIRAAGERALRERTGFHVDHRLVRADGAVLHVSEQAELGLDEVTGEPVKLVGTTLDITQRKRAEEEVAAASRAKDQFLAMLSHELRTPLTPVVLAVDALRDDEALPSRVREDLDMIRRNVGLEAKLIDDLLDLTRVARGKLELHRERIDVHAALQHAVRSCYNVDGHEKRLSVRLDLAARAHHVRADAARLEQVFFNLLRNAIKFTPAGGSIDVRTRDAGDGVAGGTLRVEVSDSGVGIAPDVLPRLFNAFEQGNRAVTRHFGGLGLGLAICKAIVDLHGGAIRAHSDGHSRGATFVVELPTVPTSLATGDELLSAPPARADSAGRMPNRAVDGAARLLLVEDHETTAAMMLRLFKRLGYDVKSAGDVATAISLAERHPFDLVISDLGLPDGNGLDLMRHLRDRYGLRGIALSGFGMEEDLIQSKAAGFSEHLVKPVSFDKLELTIHRVMRGGAVGEGDASAPEPRVLADT
jgi:PAS domain S-box-containing protein